jgi:hypothetical protein
MPKKCTFLSHFHLKNARFSATSAQKMHVFQPLPPEKGTFFSHFCPKKSTFFSHFHLKNARFSVTSAQKTHVFQPLPPENARFSATST